MLQRFRVLGMESSSEVQTHPQSGQIFLYDRAVVRHFRRDVHEWKKKRCCFCPARPFYTLSCMLPPCRFFSPTTLPAHAHTLLTETHTHSCSLTRCAGGQRWQNFTRRSREAENRLDRTADLLLCALGRNAFLPSPHLLAASHCLDCCCRGGRWGGEC